MLRAVANWPKEVKEQDVLSVPELAASEVQDVL
jgi:hypothetical protein